MAREAAAILKEGAELSRGINPKFAARLKELARDLDEHRWSVLVSGLCSVGKSSVVCALWGDAELLPTAVRDCTQTNTLIRAPETEEADRTIRLRYLDRVAAENFALKGLAFHRLVEMLEDYHGIAMPRLDEMLPDARLRIVADDARRLYASRHDLLVLNEPLTDDLEQLENFIAFLDSTEYRAGEITEARWQDRREHLMGKRLEDGRLAGTGKLMALGHVELLRATSWQPKRGRAPLVIDTPWIPALHNARREDLILAQARRADILLVLSLPQAFHPENWLVKILTERRELRKTTVVVFNQMDTCDPRTLFSRDGFFGVFDENRERLVQLGIDPANMLVGCARLRFLQDSQKSGTAQTPLSSGSAVAERIARLEKVLAIMREQARSRGESEFKRKLMAACDPRDAGVEALRVRMEELAATVIARRHETAAIDALLEFQPVELGADAREKWGELRTGALEVKRRNT